MNRIQRSTRLEMLLLASALVIMPQVWAGASSTKGHSHDMKGHAEETGEHEMHEHHAASFGEPGKAEDVDRTLEIEATEFKYVPDSITVQSGETVRFIVTNTGKAQHEFVLGDEAEQAEHDEMMQSMASMAPEDMAEHMKSDPSGISIAPGETAELIWKFGPAHQMVQYGCHVPGHYAAKMVGTIRVQ